MINLEYEMESGFYNYFLRTNTEEEMISSLNLVGISTYPSYNFSVNMIGSIEKETGIIDERYHANLRSRIELTKEQKNSLPLIIPIPQNIICRW